MKTLLDFLRGVLVMAAVGCITYALFYFAVMVYVAFYISMGGL